MPVYSTGLSVDISGYFVPGLYTLPMFQIKDRLVCIAERNFQMKILYSSNGIDWKDHGQLRNEGGQFSHHGVFTFTEGEYEHLILRNTVTGITQYRTLDGINWDYVQSIENGTYSVPVFYFKVGDKYIFGHHDITNKILRVYTSGNAYDWHYVREYDLSSYAIGGTEGGYYVSMGWFEFKGKYLWYIPWVDAITYVNHVDCWESINGIDWKRVGEIYRDPDNSVYYYITTMGKFGDNIIIYYQTIDLLTSITIQYYMKSIDGIHFTNHEIGDLRNFGGLTPYGGIGYGFGYNSIYYKDYYLMFWSFFNSDYTSCLTLIGWTKDGITF